MALFKRKENVVVDSSKVYATNAGEVQPIKNLKDGMFSEKMMGDGLYIKHPANAKKVDIFAPVSGILMTVFPTGHAYGIKTKNGIEVLIHLGIDTVNLNGQGFEKHVSQDKRVQKGDKLATIDVEYVRKNAPSADTILILTSTQKIAHMVSGQVEAGQELFTVNLDV